MEWGLIVKVVLAVLGGIAIAASAIFAYFTRELRKKDNIIAAKDLEIKALQNEVKSEIRMRLGASEAEAMRLAEANSTVAQLTKAAHDTLAMLRAGLQGRSRR